MNTTIQIGQNTEFQFTVQFQEFGFESFEYSEKRIASIHKIFLPSLAFIGFLHEIGFLRL